MSSTQQKPNVKYEYPEDKRGCGSSLTCLGIGCAGIFLVLVLGMIGTYYAAVHTSLPLIMIEPLIENSGAVEIEGLSGSVASGFSAKELKFKTTDNNWSNLKDLNFDYESSSSWFGANEFVIKEMSIGSGTIYVDSDSDETQLQFDGADTVGFDNANLDDDLEADSVPSLTGLNISIEKISFADLKIINVQTEFEIVIDEIEFNNFSIVDGELISIGELVVDTNQLEIETVPTQHLTEIANAQRFQGVLKQSVDSRLVADLPFAIDVGARTGLRGERTLELLDGQIKIFDTKDACRVTYNDFTPNNWVQLERPILVNNINMQIDFDRKTKNPQSVSDGASCQFGTKQFTEFSIEADGQKSVQLLGRTTVGDSEVKIAFSIDGPYSAWKDMRLLTEDRTVWAEVLFGKPLDQLNLEQVEHLEAAVGAVADNDEIKNGTLETANEPTLPRSTQ